MVEAMERYQVWRVYIDPQYIEHLVEKWSNRYGPKRVVEWLTYRPRHIAFAVREYAQAIGSGDVHHDGNETFVRHVGNARKRMLTVKDDKERLMHTLSKDSVRSPRKIDAAMAAVVSWKARSDAVELGVVSLDPEARDPLTEPEKSRWVPGTAPALGALTGAGVEVGPMGGMF
jgi:phage terminase large subunit-like protein